jgi:hypothetical protein
MNFSINSIYFFDPLEYSVVDVVEDSDSEEEEHDFDISAIGVEESDSQPPASQPPASQPPDSSVFRCIMCEKEFRHAGNLNVHLQTHLGTTAKLMGCLMCKRYVHV